VEWWIVDGTLSAEPVKDAETVFGADGPWRLDRARPRRRTLHVGLGVEGAIELDEAIEQAKTERDAGALLLRDAGSPTDTRTLDDHDDLPASSVRPHLARPRRYQRGFAIEVGTSRSCRPQWPSRPAGVTVGSSWSPTGSTAISATWRRCGPTRSSSRRSTLHTTTVRGSPRTCFSEDALPGLINAGIDCIEHGTG